MQGRTKLAVTAVVAAAWLASGLVSAQTRGEREDFTAVAVVNNNLGSGAGNVQIQVTRWSSEAERNGLVTTLREKGPMALLEALQDMRPVGIIKTPDSLGYDLRYAHQVKGEDGGRRIVIATDRPIGFWEARNQPRTVDYPFTVVQMQIGADGRGKGTLSYATKIRAEGNTIELENFATSPVMLTQIEARPHRD